MELLNVHIFCRFKVVNVLEEILLAVESVDDHTRRKEASLLKLILKKPMIKLIEGTLTTFCSFKALETD